MLQYNWNRTKVQLSCSCAGACREKTHVSLDTNCTSCIHWVYESLNSKLLEQLTMHGYKGWTVCIALSSQLSHWIPVWIARFLMFLFHPPLWHCTTDCSFFPVPVTMISCWPVSDGICWHNCTCHTLGWCLVVNYWDDTERRVHIVSSNNLCNVNVIYVISLTKFDANSVAPDSASVSWLVSAAAVANFVGSCCGCDLKLCQLWHRGNLCDVNVINVIILTKFDANWVSPDSASISWLVQVKGSRYSRVTGASVEEQVHFEE